VKERERAKARREDQENERRMIGKTPPMNYQLSRSEVIVRPLVSVSSPHTKTRSSTEKERLIRLRRKEQTEERTEERLRKQTEQKTKGQKK
jgi:hypothetical protein